MNKFRVWDNFAKEYDKDHHFFICQRGKLYLWDLKDLIHAANPDRYTIEHSTGLVDIDGKDIFQGDIAKGKIVPMHRANPNDEHFDIGHIKMNRSGSWAISLPNYGLTVPIYNYIDTSLNLVHDFKCHLQVIGNIHEHAHLLENKE